MEDWAIRGRMIRSAMTRHSGDALRTHCSKTTPWRTGFHRRACDRRSFRSVNFMCSSWLRVALTLCSGQVVVRVANVLPGCKSRLPASSLNWIGKCG